MASSCSESFGRLDLFGPVETSGECKEWNMDVL